MQYQERQRRNNLFVKKLRENPTKEELVFKRWLEDNKVYFKFQKGFLRPYHRIVDFYIPKKKIIIEIDGDYHKDVHQKDFMKDVTWAAMGYLTIRIPNFFINDGTFIKIKTVKDLSTL